MANQHVLRFVIQGSFCSFRDPVAAKYQPTFWFPPKTTIVGFLGCALGLEPPDLEPLYDSLRVGVVMLSWGGIARDLWGFTKLKGTTKPETAVTVRELLYQPVYALYVGADDVKRLERLQQALLDPVFPLRLGRGEDLAMLVEKPRVIPLLSAEVAPWLRWTLLPFAMHDRACALEAIDVQPRRRLPPRLSRMPIRFHYDNDWVREAEAAWVTQVFDWGVRPGSVDGMWTDGERAFYLI